VLVVTPVIFFWLQERRLGLQRERVPATHQPALRWRPIAALVAVLIVVAASVFLWRQTRLNQPGADLSSGQTVQMVRTGELQIAILSPTGTLHQGRNTFTIEFRSVNGRLIDAGGVRASGNMPMPGMVMSGGMEVHPTTAPGRYEATAEFGMAGAWHMAIEWDGPAGQGSVNFEGAVQ